MGSGYSAQPQGNAALIQKIKDIQTQQAALNRRINGLGLTLDPEANSLIVPGGRSIEVQGGDVNITDGGTLTIENADGQSIPLSQLAFGMAAASAAGAVAAGTKAAWTSDGLSVGVDIHAGRALVIIGALLTLGAPTGTDTASGYYSFAVDGPTPSDASTGRSFESQFGSFGIQGSAAFVVAGLTPGAYTITGSVMRTTSGSNAAPTVTASKRSIVVLPF